MIDIGIPTVRGIPLCIAEEVVGGHVTPAFRQLVRSSCGKISHLPNQIVLPTHVTRSCETDI